MGSLELARQRLRGQLEKQAELLPSRTLGECGTACSGCCRRAASAAIVAAVIVAPRGGALGRACAAAWVGRLGHRRHDRRPRGMVCRPTCQATGAASAERSLDVRDRCLEFDFKLPTLPQLGGGTHRFDLTIPLHRQQI